MLEERKHPHPFNLARTPMDEWLPQPFRISLLHARVTIFVLVHRSHKIAPQERTRCPRKR